MADVLLVSKPVEPPWNDSSKNLVRDLATSLTRHVPVVMTRKRGEVALPWVRRAEVYAPSSGGYAPSIVDNARAFARILVAHEQLVHFFFAPNPRSAKAARGALAVRRLPSIHTICSAPRAQGRLREMLFADRNVVLSAHTERRFLDAGVPPTHLRRIPPAITPLDPMDDAARKAARRSLGLPVDAALVVYPGDLEFGRGAAATIEAVAGIDRDDVVLVMACRAKTPAAKQAESDLRGLARTLGVDRRMVWTGETPRIHALLGAADVVALPSDTLYAKMDYPLVLLEAMSLERPVIVGRGTPAEELAEGGGPIVSSCDSDEVRSHLVTLLDHEDVRARRGAAGRSAVLARFVPKAMAASYESLYDELLG